MIFHQQVPAIEEQQRILNNCDVNIDMFEKLAVGCHPSHRENCVRKAGEQRAIKEELIAYFSGQRTHKDISWFAKEKMMVMPDWATYGT